MFRVRPMSRPDVKFDHAKAMPGNRVSGEFADFRFFRIKAKFMSSFWICANNSMAKRVHEPRGQDEGTGEVDLTSYRTLRVARSTASPAGRQVFNRQKPVWATPAGFAKVRPRTSPTDHTSKPHPVTTRPATRDPRPEAWELPPPARPIVSFRVPDKDGGTAHGKRQSPPPQVAGTVATAAAFGQLPAPEGRPARRRREVPHSLLLFNRGKTAKTSRHDRALKPRLRPIPAGSQGVRGGGHVSCPVVARRR